MYVTVFFPNDATKLIVLQDVAYHEMAFSLPFLSKDGLGESES